VNVLKDSLDHNNFQVRSTETY